MKKWIALLLLAALGLQLSACTQAVAAEDLMEGITPNKVETLAPDDTFATANAQFSLALLQNSYKSEENVVLSPYSALMALAMTANGAQGTTLSQMEVAFGLPMEKLNRYLAGLTSSEELQSANSLWIREGLSVEKDFLQTNADYYNASVYRAKFNQDTVDDINTWVKEHTKERIDKIVDEISPDAMLYLINALSFDAKWADPYEDTQVIDDDFTAANGEVQTVEMLQSSEHRYLETAQATGFMKAYKGNRYYYFSLLPNEDVSMQAFLEGLDGETLSELLRDPQGETVYTRMPKLKLEYAQSLKDALQAMGITEAFSDVADFSAMSERALKIDDVQQKVYFELDEQGTKAAAVTSVTVGDAAMAEPEDPKYVYLTRPYVMGIYDAENQCILFLGVINSVE